MSRDCYLITDAGTELVEITVFQSPSLLTIENILGEITYWIAVKGEGLGVLVDVSNTRCEHTPLGYVRYARFLLRHPELRVAVYGGGRMVKQQITIINEMSHSTQQLRLLPNRTQALAWLLTARQTAPPRSSQNGA
jgi:hypothetical protein